MPLLSSEIFNQVVHYLDNHQESLRIKKLIFCICKKYWENDLTILNSVPLNELIQELLQVKPSNEQLTFSIYKLVKTLNRPKVYAPLAKIIIDQVGRLEQSGTSLHAQSSVSYSSNGENTLLISNGENTLLTAIQAESTTINKSSELVIDKIVDHLTNHREHSRIKKLIFAVCKNRWENNLDTIYRYGLKNLILELRHNYETKQKLRQSFKNIVENINKKNVYLALESLILSQIEMLYDTSVDYEEKNRSSIETETKIIETQIIHFDQTEINDPEKTIQVYPLKQENTVREQNFATSIIEFNKAPFLNEINVTLSPPSSPIQQPQREYDLLEIRVEIMQYTNPLRAKILLYSLLFHPWDKSGQDWSTLKSYTLENLLEQTILSGKSIKEIERTLSGFAKHQTDVETNLQTVSIIVQAIGHIL